MPFQVMCKPRPWPGRHRAGMFFPVGVPQVLEVVPEAVLQDPELIVEEVPAEVAPVKPRGRRKGGA